MVQSLLFGLSWLKKNRNWNKLVAYLVFLCGVVSGYIGASLLRKRLGAVRLTWPEMR